MNGRRALIYFAWSRPAETSAPLTVIEDRFPAVFELRRLFYPKFEALSGDQSIDQGIAGFLDHVQKPNFQSFAEQAETHTGERVAQIERIADDGILRPLSSVLEGIDTLIVISFDSLRTGQIVSAEEIQAISHFLTDPDHLLFVCPHHDIGEVDRLAAEEQAPRQLAEFKHHGDHGIPPRQGFGGVARSVLAGLGVPVENRFGLRPAATAQGEAAPVEIDRALDRLGLLQAVEAFHLHAHLPQLERLGPALQRMDVLAQQPIDSTAPPHPFTQNGRSHFDALLQSKADTFQGTLLVCDTTMFSSTAGGLENLRRFWANVVQRPRRSSVSHEATG